eukprot:403351576
MSNDFLLLNQIASPNLNSNKSSSIKLPLIAQNNNGNFNNYGGVGVSNLLMSQNRPQQFIDTKEPYVVQSTRKDQKFNTQPTSMMQNYNQNNKSVRFNPQNLDQQSPGRVPIQNNNQSLSPLKLNNNSQALSFNQQSPFQNQKFNPFLQQQQQNQQSPQQQQQKQNDNGVGFLGTKNETDFKDRVKDVLNPQNQSILNGNTKNNANLDFKPLNRKPLKQLIDDFKLDRIPPSVKSQITQRSQNPKIDDILNMDIDSAKDYMKKIESEIMDEINKEDPFSQAQNLLDKQELRDKVDYYKNKLMRWQTRYKNMKVRPFKKFKAAAIAISKFCKIWKEIRDRRIYIKEVQLREFGKLIDLNIKISRSWIIQINSRLLKSIMFSKIQVDNMSKEERVRLNYLKTGLSSGDSQKRFTQVMIRVKTMLDNIQNNSITKLFPEPTLKFLSQITKLGQYIPPAFLNRYEQQMNILDQTGATNRLYNGQQMTLICFYLFEKVILKDLTLQPADTTTQNRDKTKTRQQSPTTQNKKYDKSSLKNLKILGFTVYYLALVVIFQIQCRLPTSKIDLKTFTTQQVDEVMNEFCLTQLQDFNIDNETDDVFIPRFRGVYSFFKRNPKWYVEMQNKIIIIIDRLYQLISLQQNQVKNTMKQAFDKMVIFT